MLARQETAFAASAETVNAWPMRADLARQAAVARQLGSPFVSAVLEAARRQLDRAPRLAARIDHWPGDFAADAVAMRLNAGLHALARRNEPPVLGELFRHRRGDFDAAIGAALVKGEDVLLRWLDFPTQTNEVGRSAAFTAALLTIAARDPKPFELIELGASAGLNLNLGRYRHELGGTIAGDRAATLTIAPAWAGSPPPSAPITIMQARGVDLRPVDISDPDARERMMAFVWADRDDRAHRLARALRIAQSYPPQVEQGEVLEWLPQQLAAPQPAGVRRVVMHSMIVQYLPESERRGLAAALLQAGSRATRDRPLAWISLEWTRDRREVQLRLTDWSDGTGQGVMSVLAVCHPYGASVDWQV